MPQPPLSCNEHIFELRYKPLASLVDFRGQLAESISSHMTLPIWEIIENRIDIYTEDKTAQAFVSFRNCGFILQDTTSASVFPDKAQRFLRHLLSLPPFASTVPVERLGVRSKFATPFDAPFEQLVARISERYTKLNPSALTAWGDPTVVDVGVPLNLRDKDGRFNTVVGPVRKDEFPRYMRARDAFPSVGLFVDIDYWDRPTEPMSLAGMLSKIGRFATSSWQKSENFRSYLLDG
jgi:hypothetical protein